jgi:hypothetical protein
VRSAPLLLASLALGCAPVELPPGLAGAQIQRAWIEEYEWWALGLVGGGITGSGWLYAEDTQGQVHEQYVELRGGLLGFAFEFSGSAGRTVELDLPPAPITGADLFSRYSGSFEAFVVGVGFASLHLRNEPGVELDDQGLSMLMAVSISAAWMRLVPAEPPPEPDTSDSADTGYSPPPDETGDTRSGEETGDSGAEGEMGGVRHSAADTQQRMPATHVPPQNSWSSWS